MHPRLRRLERARDIAGLASAAQFRGGRLSRGDSAGRIRIRAVEALARAGGSSSVQALVEVALGGYADAQARAAEHLGSIDGGPRALVDGFVADERSDARSSTVVLDVLERCESRAGSLLPLLDRSDDLSSAGRERAIVLLVAFSEDCRTNLLAALQDPRRRVLAADALAATRDIAATPVLFDMLDAAAASERAAAVAGLARIQDPRAALKLIEMVEEDADGDVRAAAHEALASLGPASYWGYAAAMGAPVTPETFVASAAASAEDPEDPLPPPPPTAARPGRRPWRSRVGRRVRGLSRRR